MRIFSMSSFIVFVQRNLHILFVTVLALCVFVTNLGGQGLSLDEPLTVTVARTVLLKGYPSAWDGQVFLGGPNNTFTTAVHGIYFWTWYPWFQFYVIALFLLFFGNSVAMLRLPFALFGVVTVVLTYKVALDLFKSKWLAVLLSLQLVFLMPFFLYSRQINYYSPSACFSIILLWLLVRFINNKPTKRLVLVFGVTSGLLLMTNSLIWLSSMPAFILWCVVHTYKRYRFVHVLQFVRDLIRGNKAIMGIIFGEAVLCYIWFLVFSPFGGQNPMLAYANGRPNVFIGVTKFLSYENNFIFPFIVFPFVFLAAWKLQKLTWFWILFFWIGCKMVVYALFIIPHGRFLTDTMAVSILFFGFVYSYLIKHKQVALAVLLSLLVTTTNVLSLAFAYLVSSHERQFRFYPTAIVIELTQTYQPAYLQVSKYLAQHARPGDLFWSNYSTLEIYLNANVPFFSPALTCGAYPGLPVDAFQQKRIRWYIFYNGLSQSVTNHTCLGPKWQAYMERNYHKYVFPLHEDTYAVNDPDIVNRQFPTFKIPTDTITIYERK